MKKALSWAALIFTVIWVFHNPGQAASDFHQAVHVVDTLASSL